MTITPSLCSCWVRIPDYFDQEDNDRGYTNETTWVYQVGCGRTCGKMFAQGHDAKLKSELLKAYRAKVDVALLEGSMLVSTDARTHAEKLGWLRYLTDAPARKPSVRKPHDNAEFPRGSKVEVSYRSSKVTGRVMEIKDGMYLVEGRTKSGKPFSRGYKTAEMVRLAG